MNCFPSIVNDIIKAYCGWHADIVEINPEFSPDGKWYLEVRRGFDGPCSFWHISVLNTETNTRLWSKDSSGYMCRPPTWGRNSRYFKFAARRNGDPQFYRVDIWNAWGSYTDDQPMLVRPSGEDPMHKFM